MKRLLPLVLVPVLALAGCSAAGGGSTADGRIRVVASTDVWGDVVEQVGGSAVQVDSIISDPDRDPHEYQADPRDQLAVSRAKLVVVNGGGYDDFLEQLLKNAPASTETVNAAESSGLDLKPSTGQFNEHLWYDLPVVSRVAGVIADELTKVDPSKKADFAARLRTFRDSLAALEATEASIRTTAAGEGVAITEPVPLYMTAALGLVNRTPPAFSEAIEEGDDVAPAVLREQLALLREHRVQVLAYNEQTTGATTQQVLAAAKEADVPVVGVRETLPDGQDYLQWMQHDLAALRTALER
ncbi:metal ABC transporter solute-binding protein, Zn/Mn family [Amnibacterium kyonggiense]|uniref:Zinc/manganese transport system substrate-binding protein n=1 Tax=Amnibacterium kyonggiense TaxID=595671 RepID=A0A4R7FQ60_9MICO|nr:zinc ABC transporter substrate-binding protein [Amnibacterium kyonggiense]TDS79863.1 zinc/manganese transport system substrate-binding protein [Amnibacterium kyonggiense]